METRCRRRFNVFPRDRLNALRVVLFYALINGSLFILFATMKTSSVVLFSCPAESLEIVMTLEPISRISDNIYIRRLLNVVLFKVHRQMVLQKHERPRGDIVFDELLLLIQKWQFPQLSFDKKYLRIELK